MSGDASGLFTYRYTSGIVRAPGMELTRAISSGGTAAGIDVPRARSQHARYAQILEDLGIDLIRLDADPLLPDGCFVEDACVMLPDAAVITNPGAPARRAEVRSVERAVAPHREIVRIDGTGTLDGGDVLRIGRTYLIGLSERTDRRGAGQLTRIVEGHGADARFVEVPSGLHLKSAVTPLSQGAVLGLPLFLADPAFDGVEKIAVPESEAAAACVLAVNGTIIVADGFPETRQRIERAGFSVIPCDISEFAKADGGLTCLSVLW
jgi:dimethylargininase